MIYNTYSEQLFAAYDKSGNSLLAAYDKSGNNLLQNNTDGLPILYGDLVASRVVPLPDLYESGRGFTCTGLAFDKTTQSFLVGDYGSLLPSGSPNSQIVRLASDFSTVIGTISLSAFSGMKGIQGIAIDTTDGSIWFCAPEVNKLYHTNTSGQNLGSISASQVTGIAYSEADDTLWILDYLGNITNITKQGVTIATYSFAYNETLDQCFLDESRGYLYIVGGANYSSRNNVYLFDINTHEQSIACTVDSYAVEGICLVDGELIILNDGYYHSATVSVNQANVYDIPVNNIYQAARVSQTFAGGYIEIQPDSWDGSTPCAGDIVLPTDSTAWGFPMSLSDNAKASIKADILSGKASGVSFIRFPMGFGYRGYRNVDQTTGLAKNIGQRFDGQNDALKKWFLNIAADGGGLSVEYWCPAPYWLTGGAYYNSEVNNELWAGGSYGRTTTLSSIKSTDPTQYAAQIDAFTDAIVDDLEYVHQNICPVRMYTLAAEPTGSGQLKYGHCHWSSDVYNDVFKALISKVEASTILSTYNGYDNIPLMHLCADDTGFSVGQDTITYYPSKIWGYSHDVIRPVNGESGDGADTIKTLTWPTGSSSSWENVFICEYEYFTNAKTDQFRCANNIVRMLLELTVRKARIVMPIIHVCKPTGQSSSQTNTAGYCLYAVDMETGSYTVNAWAYNSWKMINDNLDVGALLISGGATNVSKTAFAVYDFDSKTKVFIGNYNSAEITATIATSGQHSVVSKLYNLDSVGVPHTTEADGNNIIVTVPAYSGVVIVADEQMTVSGVTAEQEEITPLWEAGYINDSGVLATNTGSYVATAYTEASGAIRIQTSYGVQNIRLAEYDSSKNFIQREYTSGGDSTFTLNANTRYVRIGFKFTTEQSESVVDGLFENGYTFTQL